jgi:hypothetical protein
MTPRRWFAVFVAILAVTAILLVAGLFHAMKVVRQPGYAASTGDPEIQLQDSAFTLRNTSCDVVIDGDSTANVGIDPRVIAEQTGLTACNIATNRPNTDDLGTMPLDHFLANNPKPKLIVFQLGPEDFYRAKSPWQHAGPYTPLLLLSRHLPQRDALRIMIKHPAETTQFLLYVLQHEAMPLKFDSPKVAEQFRRALEHAQQSNGQLDLNLPAQTTCRAPALALFGPLDTTWADKLRQKYSGLAIPVLVRAAPLPACDPQLAKFQHDLAPLVDGNVEALPIGMFVAGDRHTTQEGSQADTMGLVKLIEERFPNFVRQPATP